MYKLKKYNAYVIGIFLHFLLQSQYLFFFDIEAQENYCATQPFGERISGEQKGGKYLTASGTLNVLVIFAKFKNDSTIHPYWPVESYPEEMSGYIDSNEVEKSKHFLNLTNYYSQMSFGRFKVTGKAIGIQTRYSIDHYNFPGSSSPNRSDANKEVLELADSIIDYNNFDEWEYISDYYHRNEPDGVVDMVVIIWRGLVFSTCWCGESSLGGGTNLIVENDKKIIKMGFGGYAGLGSYGSGVTVQYWGERSPERNFKTVIHEIAHWLINSEHPYNQYYHTAWGMLTPGDCGISANSYEREKLGWIYPTLIQETILGAPLSDYLTTPVSYKYIIPNGFFGEAFYFENHQRLSIYDDISSNPIDKGIFILHISNNYYIGDCLRIITSDGFWKWISSGVDNCWGNYVPSFKKRSVHRQGYGNRDKIFINSVCSEFLYSFTDEYNNRYCNDWMHGFGFTNAFSIRFNDVFSAWSNPPAMTWSGSPTDLFMEVIAERDGIVTLRFAISNPAGCKPSKPPIGLDPNFESEQFENGVIHLAWGADYWDSLPIEPDIDFSELEMSNDSIQWDLIYSGSDRFYLENRYTYSLSGNKKVYFRARIRDQQGKWSLWSDPVTISLIDTLTVLSETAYSAYTNNELFNNYPNPFNSSTIIKWSSSHFAFTQLKIFDLLGNEIIMLINEYRSPGTYSVDFPTGRIRDCLTSGLYICVLRLGDRTKINKMILLK